MSDHALFDDSPQSSSVDASAAAEQSFTPMDAPPPEVPPPDEQPSSPADAPPDVPTVDRQQSTPTDLPTVADLRYPPIDDATAAASSAQGPLETARAAFEAAAAAQSHREQDEYEQRGWSKTPYGGDTYDVYVDGEPKGDPNPSHDRADQPPEQDRRELADQAKPALADQPRSPGEQPRPLGQDPGVFAGMSPADARAMQDYIFGPPEPRTSFEARMQAHGGEQGWTPVRDPASGDVVGFQRSQDGVDQVADLNGRTVWSRETPLEADPIQPTDFWDLPFALGSVVVSAGQRVGQELLDVAANAGTREIIEHAGEAGAEEAVQRVLSKAASKAEGEAVTDVAAKSIEARLSASEYRAALERVFPGQHLDPVARTIDEIGQRAAERAMKDPVFTKAMQEGEWWLAGRQFHRAAEEEINLLAKSPQTGLPPGWTLKAEEWIQRGEGGSRADLLLRGPDGRVVEIDWKTSGLSALRERAVEQMDRHADQIGKIHLARQESRSWVDYVRAHLYGSK